ncbi:MAG: efflux RND transporter permease subunit [Isosphaeraceae bacterium]
MITRACKASPDWMRIGAVPGVLAGIVVILAATNTTLNIESFMGSIMCLGVSVSNSVMLITFINDYWKGGFSSSEAAAGAGDRLRPILMTACAMTAIIGVSLFSLKKRLTPITATSRSGEDGRPRRVLSLRIGWM